jgi:hypothetical protein
MKTEYRTQDHGPAPQFVLRNGMSCPTELAIQQGDTAYLAELGLFPHEYPDEPHLLGIDWVRTGDTYVGTPAGNEADRAAALAAQELATVRPKWKERSAAVRKRERRDIVLDTSQTTEARILALHGLITGEDNG